MNILLWVTLSFVVLLLLSMRCLAKKASPMTDYNDDNLYK